MIGAVIFVIFFLAFLAITVGIPTLPPGDMIQQQILQIPPTSTLILGIPGWILINAIINGAMYGFLIWLIFSLFSLATGRGKKQEQQTIQQTVNVEVQEKTVKDEQTIKTEETEITEGEIPIKKIEGIGTTFAERLVAEGIITSKDLLKAGKTRKRREELSEKTGISSKLILEWVNLADLIRVKGISEEYSDLLEEAGVDTVVELARRNPGKLHTKILELNKEKKIVRRTPSARRVKDWIQYAKKLPRVIEY
jgi:predicted flap endonuclease-1-like 5' DNA nuclease